MNTPKITLFRAICLFFAVILAITLYDSFRFAKQLQPSTTKGYSTFVSKNTITIDVPEGWNRENETTDSGFLNIFTNTTVDPNAQIAESLMLIISPNQKTLHASLATKSDDYLEAYADWYIKDQTKKTMGFHGAISKRETLHGYDILFVTSSFTAGAFNGTIAADTAFIYKNDAIYVIQYSHDQAVPGNNDILAHAVETLSIFEK